jgi:hypothetical protein
VSGVIKPALQDAKENPKEKQLKSTNLSIKMIIRRMLAASQLL